MDYRLIFLLSINFFQTYLSDPVASKIAIPLKPSLLDILDALRQGVNNLGKSSPELKNKGQGKNQPKKIAIRKGLISSISC